MRPGWRRAPAKLEPVGELRKQADIAVRVLKVFRGAALLLDEVKYCACIPGTANQMVFSGDWLLRVRYPCGLHA